MFIRFTCTSCSTSIEVDASGAGANVNCPRCGAAVTVPERKLGPGIVLGGFLITEHLASGGMGDVYLARQLSMDRAVALKILTPQITESRERVESFLNEVRLIARLHHPNIVTAYEAGEDEGVYFLAMAYIPGENIERLCARSGPLPEKQALMIVRKLAEALTYAWEEHHLLHRDVKPDNVMLDSQGDPNLMDFGISQKFIQGGSSSDSTHIVGTPNYMSPEQIRADGPVDFRADMYALGATLYFMLTGHAPFESKDVDETWRMAESGTLPDPRRVQADLSPGCLRLLTVMMARSPAHRYSNWSALCKDVNRVLADQAPVHPAPPESDAVLRCEAVVDSRAGGHRERSGHPTRLVVHRGATHLVSEHKPTLATGTAAHRGKGAVRWVVPVIGLLVVMGIVGFVMARAGRSGGPSGVPKSGGIAEPASPTPGSPDAVAELLVAAEAYARTNGSDRAGAIARFTRVCVAAPGTDHAARAAKEIERLQLASRDAVDAAWGALETQVDQLIAEEKIAAAVRALEEYAGPFVAETQGSRKKWAQQLRERLSSPAAGSTTAALAPATQAMESAATAEFETVAYGIAGDLLCQDFAAALAKTEAAQTRAALSTVKDWKAFKRATEQVAAMPQLILDSFQRDQGNEVPVDLRSGLSLVRILSVRDGMVRASRQVETARIQFAFGLRDLTVKEKALRLRMTNDSPERAIMCGLLAYEGKEYGAALKAFDAATCPLAIVLKQRLEKTVEEQSAVRTGGSGGPTTENAADEAAAQAAFVTILRHANVLQLGASSEEQCTIIRSRVYRQAEVATIEKCLENFNLKYAGTKCAAANKKTLLLLGTVRANDPLGVEGKTDTSVQSAADEAAAQAAFVTILRQADVLHLNASPEDQCTIIRGKVYRQAQIATIRKSLENFNLKYAGTKCAAANKKPLTLLGTVCEKGQ